MASVIVVQRRDRLDCAMRRLLCTSGRRREDEEKLGYAICYYAVEVISNSRSVLFDAEDVTTGSGRNVNLLKKQNRMQDRIQCLLHREGSIAPRSLSEHVACEFEGTKGIRWTGPCE
jgi:hypothetical protein